MQEVLLEISNVNIDYNGKNIVNNINLEVKPGEILGIVGESGSGKSTLIRAAMGILSSGGKVTSGEIKYKGKSLLNMDNEALRKMRGPEIGMIFQNCANFLCPIRTIGDQLYEAMKEHNNISRKEVYDTAIRFLKKLNLDGGRGILDSYPFELSGGMNQRVGIIMSMILKPQLLFADEPTSALDVIAQGQVVEELIKLRNDYGTAIVIVTHNIALTSYMTDKIAVMRNGELVEYGDTKEVINNPKEEYTKRLIKAVPRIRRR